MLQEASTRLIVPEPSEDLIANEPWSIENYADGLMDELFADIDYILDVSGNLPSQTVRHSSQKKPSQSVAGVSAQAQHQSPPEYVPPQTVTIPQILPNTLNQPLQSVAQDNHKQLSTVLFDGAAVKPVSKKRQKSSPALGKLLIVGTTLGVAIAGMIYLVQSGVVYLLNTKLPESALLIQQPQSQLPVKTEIEAELVDYMLQALAVIDKQGATPHQKSFSPRFSSQANTNQIAVSNEQTTANLPALPLLASNNTLPAPNRSGNVVERIYVPVYQAPSPMRYALPAIPGTPTLLPQVASVLKGSQPNVVKNALNTVRQAGKPVTVNMLAAAVRAELQPVAAKTAPITVRQAPKPLPALPVVPLRAALAPSEPTITQEQVYPPTAIAEAPSNTLEGLLELGDKSAALFKIDGVTRRINMGESIGSSGWTLVDVSNGEAVIRRNGEVRSIYAGQKL
ncbi:hypothetical protein ANSO36C_04310 [Nostoc cf. commune SO-36]|uniref:Type II secretion system protein GspC N-terminal domain-containing protein n=1 Tax=Nostoc cf. commune SO-36 TaxID=449208 RepID=A0ABN6PYM4_NOSCO|nr:hypothetical protein [Nostoc commune]BDI14629.1 hypothetical protein ANSO36C_04310 [Nostoc cf. commune SO-36]